MDSANDLNWDELLSVDLMSLDEERDTSPQISNYILKNNNNNLVIDALEPLNDKIAIIYSYNKLKENTLLIENWINSLELIKGEAKYPGGRFPDIKNINEFIFLIYELSSFSDNILRSNYFTDEWLIESLKNFEESTFDLIDALTYFGFVHYKEEDYENKYFFSDVLKNIASKKLNEKYLEILKIISTSKTCKELLIIQHYTRFDNMTKSIMNDKLSNDPNIIENRKTVEQKNKIINNFRSWYLDICSVLIPN